MTERETKVLRLLAAGHGNREIGERLCISPWTVARRVVNIYGKLGVASRAKGITHVRRHAPG